MTAPHESGSRVTQCLPQTCSVPSGHTPAHTDRPALDRTEWAGLAPAWGSAPHLGVATPPSWKSHLTNKAKGLGRVSLPCFPGPDVGTPWEPGRQQLFSRNTPPSLPGVLRAQLMSLGRGSRPALHAPPLRAGWAPPALPEYTALPATGPSLFWGMAGLETQVPEKRTRHTNWSWSLAGDALSMTPRDPCPRLSQDQNQDTLHRARRGPGHRLLYPCSWGMLGLGGPGVRRKSSGPVLCPSVTLGRARMGTEPRGP